MPRDSNDNNWIEDLYREDRGDAPPAVLDAAIMEAAAQAIGDPDTVGGRVAPWYRRASRLSAIASAAVVLLTVGIWTSQPGPEPALLPAPPPADASANTELRDAPERATEDRGPPRSQARETAVEFTDPATPLAPPPSPSPAPGPAAAPAQVPAPAATGNNSDPEPDNSAVSPEFRDQAEAKPGARRIEEVIVTAERREASIQDTSISITAFTGEMLSDFGIRNQSDFGIRNQEGRENYTHFDTNPVHLVATDPVSTFSIDVDTASYSNLRRHLATGNLPRHDAVRIEELINYFSYSYAVPTEDGQPFAVYTETGPSPWHADRHLLHIGIKGYELDRQELPPANLVFLIDVSGSMHSPDKLDLLKASLKLLTRQLDAADRISIAVYAGAAGLVLEPTPGDQQATILAAIDRLSAGGSTNGGAGIRLAYSLAQQGSGKNTINRVILATDGDFNVGTTNPQALEDLVAEKRKSGVALTVLGFGTGNYNDALMQKLAQIGNGNAAYIDTLNEARKVLVDELTQTLNIIAEDVKIQIEFNPATVREYRLIGYETRHLNREDFNNDKIDAGDIGAGHTVTALYELALKDSRGALIDDLRYGGAAVKPDSRILDANKNPLKVDELAFLKIRYKTPGATQSTLITTPIRTNDIVATLDQTSENFRFAAAVAGFGQLLRGGEYVDNFDYRGVVSLAASARGNDLFGYRGEFLGLVRTADSLATPVASRAGVDPGVVDLSRRN
jgi:Ca-activated chloride channel family protein